MVLLLLALVPNVVAFAPPRQGRPVLELSASAGYNGFYRKGQWVAVLVTVSNNGDNLDGYVRARTGEGSGLEETTYSTPIDLPRGSRKQIFLYVSLDSYTQRIQIEVIDRQDQVVERATADLRMAGPGDILYAVVTESPFGALDLTARAPGAGLAHQTNWRLENIPPLAEALAGLDVMLFHDVDTGALTAEQVAAIRQWVLSGGHLIIVGGDAWQRTTSGLQEILPVTLSGTTPVRSVGALADYVRLPDEPLDEEMTVAVSAPLAGAEVIAEAADTPLLVRGRYGGGVVDFLAVDPHAEPLRSWEGKADLWLTLVASVGQQPSWMDGFKNWSIARDATTTISSTVLPTILQLCGFLGLYIALVGPVNYLVLKRLNRRELAWFTIPALILVFSFLAYTVGFNLRGNVATVNRLTVIQVWPASDQAQVTALVGVQSPRRGSYDIVAGQDYTLRTLPNEGTGLNVPTVIRESTRYMVDSIPIDAGTVASFVASGYQTAPQYDAAATWHLSLDQPPRIEGYIANTTGRTLQDAVLLIKGESRYLGHLEPGETRIFDITLGPQDPGPLTLGAPASLGVSAGYSPWRYGYNSPGWCFNYGGLSLTIQDVMRGEEFVCSASGVSARQQEVRRRYRLLAALIQDVDLSGGRDAGAYVLAWSDDALVEIDLQDRPQNEEDTNLHMIALPVTVVARDEVEVPAALTTWTLAELDDPATLREVSPTQFQVSATSQAAFQFMPMPQVRLALVSELAVSFQAQGPVRVELWNWSAQQWDQVNFNPEVTTVTIRHPERFVGPENAVTVRVLAEDDTSYNRVDYIKVAYHGRLVE